MPAQEDIVSILNKIRIFGANTQKKASDHDLLNRIVTWSGRRLRGDRRNDFNVTGLHQQ